MSLEQYKDANRAELWSVLQIQSQVLKEEIRKNAELEKELKQQWECGNSKLVECKTKITELEKERDDLLSLSAMSDLKKSLAIRDVEQQKRVVQILWDAGKCDADSWGYILEALKEGE